MKNHISALFEKTETHVKTTVELFKLKMLEKSADVISSLAANLVIAFFTLLVLIFFHIGAALWIGACLGHAYLGFFIVSGFYVLITTILFIFRKRWMKNPIKELVIDKFLN
jgi:uncharacterized membrane protein